MRNRLGVGSIRQSSGDGGRPRRRGEVRGELAVRAWRYFAAVFGGYVAGLVAGSRVRVGPVWWIIAVLALLAVAAVFRRGVRSQVDAAADAVAVATARAEAAAVAAASTRVEVNAQGVVGGSGSAVPRLGDRWADEGWLGGERLDGGDVRALPVGCEWCGRDGPWRVCADCGADWQRRKSLG